MLPLQTKQFGGLERCLKVIGVAVGGANEDIWCKQEILV